MEVYRQRIVQNERMNDCQSFGSNQHPSSQSRKISIGVIDDSLVGRNSRARKEKENAVPNAEEIYCDLVKTMGRKTNEKKVADLAKTKQREAQQLVDSPWVSTRSIHRDTSIAETAIGTKRVFISPASCGKPNNSYGGKEAPETVAVTVVLDDTSILQSAESKRMLDNVHFHNKGANDTTLERQEDFSFSPAINVVMRENVGTDIEAGKVGKKTESLRMKLCEILGAVSSPPDPQSKSQKYDQGVTNLKTEENIVQKVPRAVKSGKNSDTIETDSEGLEQSITRPRTRSTKRKRIPTKLHSNKAKNDASSISKVKRQGDSAFTFKPGRRGTASGSAYGCSSFSAKSEKGVSKIKRSKIYFTENCDPTHVDQETSRTEARVSDENSSLIRNKTSKFTDCNEEPKNETAYHEPGKITEEDFVQSPLENKAEPSQDHNNSPDADQRDEISSPCFLNSLDPDPYLKSPTLKINTPGYSSSILSQKTSHVVKSSVLRKETVAENFDISSFRKLQNLKKDSASNSEDFAEEHTDFLFRRKAANTREREEEYDKSESSYEQRFESFGEGSSQRATGIGMTEKLKFMLHQTKKLKLDNIVRQKNNWIQEPLEENPEEEQNPEEELARAIKLFALELENIKSKMKSVTVKKSTEILMSASDETDLLLQNVRSQIETDVEKLTNLCKSKRKLLEKIIAEQQEQLKFIHEKFKEEVNQHLQYCKCSLHELEAQRVEIKGAMEKKKTSHRNILLQVEESIDGRLNDAQRRIKAVQELARKKMLHLKKIVAASLKEGSHNM